jgi:cell division cycle 20-like protein 1 (cofactor of APC complex)
MGGENWSSQTRKISKIPFKVLDAPSLQDDFYLNLIDWSS